MTAAGLVAVVDDDESVRRALTRLLAADGLSAEGFPSAKAFLDRLAEGLFNCVILDIHLGGMSGLDVLERLAVKGKAPPVIVITAYDDQASRERACRGGASAYLCKPIDAQALLIEVHRAIEAAVS